MGDVICFKTRQRKVLDLTSRRSVDLDTGKNLWSRAQCPYCKKTVRLPPGYSASFTCRGTEHRHMRDQTRLVEET